MMLYERELSHRRILYRELNFKLEKLMIEKTQAQEAHEELLRHLNSQSDPAFIELTLMKVLGVVPEGQTKYFFIPGV